MPDQPDQSAVGSSEPSRVRRAVTVDDPRLSDDTNRRLTADARLAVGADEVTVAADRPADDAATSSLSDGPILNRTNVRLLGRSMLTAGVVIGAILSLTTGDWYLLPVAVIVLGIATVSIWVMVARMTSTPEHPSPQTAAAMEEDGVRSPDQLFSEIVSEFTDTGDKPERGADGRSPSP